jgi:hypothetical protein
VISLPVSEYRSYLNDTSAKSFNSIEMQAITHDPGANRAPFAGNRQAPFLKRLDGYDWSGSLAYENIHDEAPDFTTPNEAYWSYLDTFIDYCAEHSINIFMFPAYVGYRGLQQGWMDEMVANGTARMRAYGVWVANRYAKRANIVWMVGGDDGTSPSPFTPEQDAVEDAFISGLKSVRGLSTDFSAEWRSESVATDQRHFGSQMTLNGVYSFSGNTATFGRNGYAHFPTIPAFLLEEPYDETDGTGTNENAAATQPVRRFIWRGMLSGIGGYIAGNGYVWRFNPGYKEHLNTRGANDLMHLNQFMNAFELGSNEESGADRLGRQ